MQNKLITISFIFIFSFAFAAKGQKLVNSPYSRFNIGSLDLSGSFRSLSMGGTGVAMRDNSTIYPVNPASYSSFDTTSFLFDFGMDYGQNVLSDGVSKYNSSDLNFNHLMMGFPLAKGWGIAIGFVPVSNGYYNISQTVQAGDPGYDPIAGEVTYLHNGDGGLTDFFLGTGFNITKNLSIGANFTILFGQLQRNNLFGFADNTNTFSVSQTENLKINGINFDYGAQYSIPLKNDYFLTAGISMTAPKKYNSEMQELSIRYASYATSAFSPDTLSYSKTSSKDSAIFPTTIRLGLSFGKKDKFTAAIDYVASNWANAKIYESRPYLANSKSLLFGIEFIPDKYSNLSYLSRIDYRLGGHVSDEYLIINGVQIREYGISCGLGLRMRNSSLSKTNIYFDFTRKKGDAAQGLFNENYYTVGLSLNMYDFWFLKKKYD
jgi:hypothetical protein